MITILPIEPFPGHEVLECGHLESPHEGNTRGYGWTENKKRHCYYCCAVEDEKNMIKYGKISLYLVGDRGEEEVTNWPGSLRFRIFYLSKGKHNFAKVRYDVWFNGPDDFIWHGVQYGDMTQVCHCKRTRERIYEN